MRGRQAKPGGNFIDAVRVSSTDNSYRVELITHNCGLSLSPLEIAHATVSMRHVTVSMKHVTVSMKQDHYVYIYIPVQKERNPLIF